MSQPSASTELVLAPQPTGQLSQPVVDTVPSLSGDQKYDLLLRLEAFIHQEDRAVFRSSIRMGMALIEIDRHRLYEQLNYQSFRDYTDDRVRYGRTYIKYLRRAANLVNTLAHKLESAGGHNCDPDAIAAAIETEWMARQLRGHEDEIVALVKRGTPLADAVKSVIKEPSWQSREVQSAAPSVPTLSTSATRSSSNGQVRGSDSSGSTSRAHQNSGSRQKTDSTMSYDEGSMTDFRSPEGRQQLAAGIVLPDDDDEEVTDLAIRLTILIEQLRDLPQSKARLVVEPLAAGLFELLGMLGYKFDQEEASA